MNAADPEIEMVRALARVRDDELRSLAIGPGKAALLDAILAEPHEQAVETRNAAAPWRSRRALAAAVALMLAAGSALAWATLRPGPAAAGIRMTVEGRFIVAQVTDPAATRQQLSAAFAQRGLDIDLQLVPASPSLVGTVVMTGGSGTDAIRTIQHGTCTPGGGCPIGVRVPVDFRGHGQITLGRQAEPGERFTSAGDGFAPGEALHCSGLRGARVGQAIDEVRRRGLHATWWRTDGSAADPTSMRRSYVTDAIPTAPDQLRITTAADRPARLSAEYLETLDRGCRP